MPVEVARIVVVVAFFTIVVIGIPALGWLLIRKLRQRPAEGAPGAPSRLATMYRRFSESLIGLLTLGSLWTYSGLDFLGLLRASTGSDSWFARVFGTILLCLGLITLWQALQTWRNRGR